MKISIVLIAALSALAACNSSKPMENAKANIMVAFANLENGKINFQNIEVEGDKCVETEAGKKAECEVQQVKLTLGFDTNFNQEGGVVKSIASGIIPNEYTYKKGDVVTLTGKFNLVSGNVGSGAQFQSWKLTALDLKKM